MSQQQNTCGQSPRRCRKPLFSAGSFSESSAGAYLPHLSGRHAACGCGWIKSRLKMLKDLDLFWFTSHPLSFLKGRGISWNSPTICSSSKVSVMSDFHLSLLLNSSVSSHTTYLSVFFKLDPCYVPPNWRSCMVWLFSHVTRLHWEFTFFPVLWHQ